ncbi:hypothetical protein [Nitratireductor soli]|nr:hypothetical protein [Nitratireductor soli]
MDEVLITVVGNKHGWWRAASQDGRLHDEIVQNRRNTKAAILRISPRGWP